tara:strand:- start:202 stop:447 length:246 start_codon:yes stop_codon:yes gene_type:complete
MIKNKYYKLIYRYNNTNEHNCEFYNLVKDPLELYNSYNDNEYKNVIYDMKIKLFEWYFSYTDIAPYKKDSRKTINKDFTKT